jgi:hypothetical protein
MTTKTLELDQNCFQHEILELLSKQRSNTKKVEILTKYRNESLVSLLIWNFDESVISLLPKGDVPFANIKEMTAIGGTLSDKMQKQIDNVHTRTIAYNGTEEKMQVQRTSLRNQNHIFYNFIKGGNNSLSSIRRETMFINLLQGLHPKEAELICLIKDKKLTEIYKVSLDNVKQSYTDIQWGGRS